MNTITLSAWHNPHVTAPPMGVFVRVWVDQSYTLLLAYVGGGWEDVRGNAYQESSVWLWSELQHGAEGRMRG